MHTNWLLPAPGTESGLSPAPSIAQIWIIPGTLLVLGLILWFVGKAKQSDRTRWLGMVPLGLSILSALGPFVRLFSDPSYSADILRNSRLLMWGGLGGSFLIPLGTTLALIAWSIYDAKMAKYR